MKMTLWPYQTYGDSAQLPVFFLHGFLGAGEDWLRVAQELEGQYFCVLPDLPGHGKNTDLPIAAPLSFDVLNQGLLALVDHLRLPQVRLVGYSMGGRAALYFAVHYPERVSSLILESVSPGITNSDERQARAAEDDRRAEAIRAEGVEAFVEHWYTLPLFQSLKTHPRREEMIARRKGNHPGWVAKAIRDLSPGRQTPVWDQLPRLEMPVLFVAGSLDEKYTRLGEQIIVRVPLARLAIIPDTGHNVHLEKPEIFIPLLREFWLFGICRG
ncbi:MAG TPA: 2-succinyl-6-hydroxy-2,4-cyclohexadiene-1-carboxylate synthase [Anaerolineales bacterium]|nr:2-succinyl-6-hydroxy-2,4-cyclohexadiene-1-carboxylate synthase [Anaerolineales bacterium]